MRSTLLLIFSFAALALAKPYNPYAPNNEDTAQLGNFFRHHHRRTHRPLLTTKQSITASAKVDKATGNIEVVTPAAGIHRTPKNRFTRGLPEQSSNIPLLVHGAGVTDNSKAHITQKDLHRHHRRRTAHPLPTGKTSTSADAGKVTGNADGVTPAAKKAAILLTGKPNAKAHRTLGGRFTRKPSTSESDAKAHRTLGGRFTRKPSTSEPDSKAHRTGWVGRLTRRPSTHAPDARAHRTKAPATGLPNLITAKPGLHATDNSAWFKGHVKIAA